MHTAVKLNEVGAHIISTKCWIKLKIVFAFVFLPKYKREKFQAIVAKSHDAKLVILNLPGPPKVVGADKDCSCKYRSELWKISLIYMNPWKKVVRDKSWLGICSM